MNAKYWMVCSFAIILLLAAAGCVAPPAENSTAAANILNPKHTGSATGTPTPKFVSEVALSDTVPAGVETAGYSSFSTTTPNPSDITCRIFSKSLPGYNASAMVFDLKNPPMYINYTVVPVNETFKKTFYDNYLKKDRTLIYSDYSRLSWFEVTVLNNDTGEEYLKEGFGEYRGLSLYLNRTIKVMKSGNIRIEFRGSNLKVATVSVWVKPIGNFNESRFSEFTDCMYWEGYRDTLTTAKPTTLKGVIYTWTPENKYTSKPATMVKQGTPVTQNKTDLYN